jgi:2-oxoglutarate ferredoxin oxidoreductase subunit alpha
MFNKSNKILITGNEAIALGALRAGLKFYAAYPMTPATSILHFLAGHEHQYKIIVKQTEDELAAMNMVIGASVAGARAMCATSGGGFALMTEALGLGGMIETPLVCAMVSRPGPATGLPTWSAQGDLQFILHAAPDEFPRIILAPGDALEAFQLTFAAFNLADKYQVPVLILSDKLLGESYFTVKKDQFEKRDFRIDRGEIISNVKSQMSKMQIKNQKSNSVFERYEVTDTGISKRSLPGTPNHLFIANSDEHDEFGLSEEDSKNRVQQMSKRMRKLKTIVKDRALSLPQWYGPKKAKITLIGWGSTKGVCLEVLKNFYPALAGARINVLHFNQLYPLDIKRVQAELSKIKKSVCVEGNYSGQFADYLFGKTGYSVDHKLLKYDGRPWFVEELEADIRGLLRG